MKSLRMPVRWAVTLGIAGALSMGVAQAASASMNKVHPTPSPTSGAPAAPTNVKAVLESNATVDVTWSADSAKQLGGYIVLRNGTQLTKLPTTGAGAPTSYVDPKPPSGTVVYAVEAYAPDGAVSAASAGQALSLTQDVGGSSGSSDNGAGAGGSLAGVTPSSAAAGNAPTAFEQYATSAGKIHETYGYFGGQVETMQLFPLTILWYGMTMISYLCLTFLAWGLTRKFYAPLASVATSFLNVWFHLPLQASLMALAVMASMILIAVRLVRGHISLTMKSVAWVFLAIGLVAGYTKFAGDVVQAAVSYPVSAGDYVLGYVNNVLPNNATSNNFNLSERPTFNGDPLQEGLRKIQDKEWVLSVYPTVCQLNFGDAQWAMTHYVAAPPASVGINTSGGIAGVASRFAATGNPVKAIIKVTPHPGFAHLTYCEFYLRDVAQGGNQDSYLTSQVHKNAPPLVWNYFQGNDIPGHYFIAGLGGWVILIRSLFVLLLVLAFAITEVMVVIFLIKWAIIGVGLILEPLRPALFSIASRMVIRMNLPIAMAALAVIGLGLTDTVYRSTIQYGWWAMEFGQLVIAIAVLVTAWSLWSRNGRLRRLLTNETIRKSVLRQFAKDAVIVGAGAATGGAAGAAAGAATQAAQAAGQDGGAAPGTDVTFSRRRYRPYGPEASTSWSAEVVNPPGRVGQANGHKVIQGKVVRGELPPGSADPGGSGSGGPSDGGGGSSGNGRTFDRPVRRELPAGGSSSPSGPPSSGPSTNGSGPSSST